MLVTRPLSDVRGDDRGAVMLTGLFMACFLIGSLWFIVGLGDTLVYRERMQEAADNGAFTAAALNAKGMNFISLCNLVLLVAVTVHIVLGIVHDIALALCIVSLGLTCGFWGSIRNLYTSYFDVLKPSARAIHKAGKVGSYGFPVMGLAEALNVGKAYRSRRSGDPVVIPLSPSLLSGASLTSMNPAARRKEGLTLEAKPMSLVCRRIGSLAIDQLFKAALGSAGRGFAGRVVDLAKSIVGRVIERRYCSGGRQSSSQGVDDFVRQGRDAEASATGGTQQQGGGGGGIDPGFNSFWGEDGPMVVISPAKNGNDWFQSYAVNLNPELLDASESRVRFGSGPRQLVPKYEKNVRPPGGFYLAQAEYFFDCSRRWSTEGCNFDGNSTFAIRWRSRLRRFSIPSFSSLLSTAGSALLTQVPQYDQFRRLQGQFDLGKDLFGGNGVLRMSELRGFLGEAGKRAEDALASEVKGAIPDIPFH